MRYLICGVIALLFAINSIFIDPIWREQLLFNGDSIVLPLLMKSIISNEVFEWNFSTQFFLFPEFFLYTISFLLTKTFESSLVLNGYLNVAILLAVIYNILKLLSNEKTKIYKGMGFFILLVACAFESGSKPMMNSSTLSELTLFSTYYFGSLVSSLICLVITLKIYLGHFTRDLLPKTVLVIMVALVYFSDPLFLIHFVIPWGLTSVLYIYIYDERKRNFFRLNLLIYSGIIIGELFRFLFRNYLSFSYKSYFNPLKIPVAFEYLVNTFIQSAYKFPSNIIIIVASLGLFNLVIFLARIMLKNNSQNFVNVKFFLISSYLFLTIIVSVSVVIFLGLAYTRYLIVIPIYLYLWTSIFIQNNKDNFHAHKIFFILIIFIFLINLIYNQRSNVITPKIKETMVLKCINQYKKKLNMKNAVGGFWTSRSLDLYSKEMRFLQVGKDLRPFNWMNNRSPYKTNIFNFVLIDKEAGDNFINEVDVLDILGIPSQIKYCGEVVLYIYDENSSGYKELNERVKK